MTQDPLEVELDKLIQSARDYEMWYWTDSKESWDSIVDKVQEIKRHILVNARWIDDCDCCLPEQSCPVCCPDLGKKG